MRLRIHPDASAEYAAVVEYYESCEEGLGLEFVDEVRAHFATLLETYERWPPWPGLPRELGLQRYRLHRFPYAIGYRVEGEEVHVYAVAAYKQKPGYWLSRKK